MITELPASKSKLPPITLRPVETPARPAGHLGFFALFTSLQGWFLLLVLYGAGIFAAYEVAVFRNDADAAASHGGKELGQQMEPGDMLTGAEPGKDFRGNQRVDGG
jgi:hypothetical protein